MNLTNQNQSDLTMGIEDRDYYKERKILEKNKEKFNFLIGLLTISIILGLLIILIF